MVVYWRFRAIRKIYSREEILNSIDELCVDEHCYEAWLSLYIVGHACCFGLQTQIKTMTTSKRQCCSGYGSCRQMSMTMAYKIWSYNTISALLCTEIILKCWLRPRLSCKNQKLLKNIAMRFFFFKSNWYLLNNIPTFITMANYK